QETRAYAVSDSASLPGRFSEFVTVLERSFTSVWIAFAAVLFGLLAITRCGERLAMLLVPLWFAVALHFSYIVFLARLWPRYYWVGVALATVATASPLLIVSSRLRLAAMVAILIGAVELAAPKRMMDLYRWVGAIDVHTERQNVLDVLSRHR